MNSLAIYLALSLALTPLPAPPPVQVADELELAQGLVQCQATLEKCGSVLRGTRFDRDLLRARAERAEAGQLRLARQLDEAEMDTAEAKDDAASRWPVPAVIAIVVGAALAGAAGGYLVGKLAP